MSVKKRKQKLLSFAKKRDLSVRRNKMSSRYLKSYSLDAKTVLDIGVFMGTPFLYDSFPNARLVLIDPTEEAKAVRDSLKKSRDVVLVSCAAGHKNSDKINLTVHAEERMGKASLKRRTSDDPGAKMKKIETSMRTVDSIVKSNFLEGPFGIKIDTEGAEIEVILGARQTLESCTFVIAEVSVSDRFENGYKFSDIISLMKKNGFEMVDVLSYQSQPRFLDCLFLPRKEASFLKKKFFKFKFS